jgi:hypothetical protein
MYIIEFTAFDVHKLTDLHIVSCIVRFHLHVYSVLIQISSCVGMAAEDIHAATELAMFEAMMAEVRAGAGSESDNKDDEDEAQTDAALRKLGCLPAFWRKNHCCGRSCWETVSDQSVAGFRSAFHAVGDATEDRDAALSSARQSHTDSGELVPCVTFQLNMLGDRTRNFIYKRSRRSKGEANMDNNVVWLSVMAWWELLMPVLDAMPDESWLQVSAPDRKSVWHWYEQDHEQWPEVYPECSYAYFNKIWRENLGEAVRLRKYTRFTKCPQCIDLRNRKRKCGGGGQKVDRSVYAELQTHYNTIRAYRLNAKTNAAKARLHPDEYLSIAQDGTEQLGFGYPKMNEFCKEMDNFRLKTKVLLLVKLRPFTYSVSLISHKFNLAQLYLLCL